jgi:hypothetical protein
LGELKPELRHAQPGGTSALGQGILGPTEAIGGPFSELF